MVHDHSLFLSADLHLHIVAAKAAVEIGWMVREKRYTSVRQSVNQLLGSLSEVCIERSTTTVTIPAGDSEVLQEVFRSFDTQSGVTDRRSLVVRIEECMDGLRSVVRATPGNQVENVSDLARLGTFCSCFSLQVARYRQFLAV